MTRGCLSRLFFTLVFASEVLAAGLCCAAEPTADFYVSLNGSDTWSGTLSEPNGQRTDGPFATLERARDAVRESGKSRSGDVVVLIRGGTYRLKKTVVFGLQDSGQGDSTITYAAYPDENPLFSSGHEIDKWKPLTAAVPGLPKEATGMVQVADVSGRFHVLFDADGLMPRARSAGFIALAGGSRNKLRFPAGLMVWQSGENRVANNLVHHTPYTGIIISGCMTHFFGWQGRELSRTIRRHELARLPRQLQLKDVRPYLHTRDNTIEYNEIHHAMEMLGDGNAIYIRGTGAGNVIRRNYIHHLVTPMIMQAAIRVCVMGDSAGGHIAQMLLPASVEQLPGDAVLAKVPYRMVAGVSWYGPCDFEKTDLFNHDDRADFRDRFAARILGSNSGPKDKLTRYREVSPINYLSKDSPPLLMIQGDKDTTIPVKHAYYMKQKADAAGAPVEIMIIENAGHNWRRVDAEIDPSREAIIERTVQFFVDHL